MFNVDSLRVEPNSELSIFGELLKEHQQYVKTCTLLFRKGLVLDTADHVFVCGLSNSHLFSLHHLNIEEYQRHLDFPESKLFSLQLFGHHRNLRHSYKLLMPEMEI